MNKIYTGKLRSHVVAHWYDYFIQEFTCYDIQYKQYLLNLKYPGEMLERL